MVSLDWELDRADGVTTVELQVRSETDEYVRIESRLEPVWPPRRQGRPVAGWTETGFEGFVEADEPLVIGYATPAEPVEPPADVTAQPATGDEQTETVTARALVRTLGEAAPPRDALPEPTAETQAQTATAGPERQQMIAGAVDGAVSAGTTATTQQATTVAGCRQPATANESQQPSTAAGGQSQQRQEAVMEPWFEAVEDRLATAESLAAATSVEEARKAIASVGGLDAVRQLQSQLAADRRRLDRLMERGETVERQLDAVEIPIKTLERVR